MRAGLLFFLSLGLSVTAYADINHLPPPPPCAFEQSCAVGEICYCMLPADNYHVRHFYVIFTHFEPRHLYQCKLSGAPYQVDFNGSTFPQGVTSQCVSENCPNFPIAINIDTQGMSEPGDIKLRYLVRPSAMSFPLTLSCQVSH